MDLESLETFGRSQGLALVAQLIAQRFNADRSDHSGPTQPCPCGGAARYAGRHPKTIETAFGPLTLERAYYVCAACGRGRFPRDEALGVAGTSLSPAVRRMTAKAAAMTSFADASVLLDELAGVRVPTKQVERTAKAIGREITRAEQAPPAESPPPPAPTVYLGIDGTGVPMRREATAGRAGKQPDGSAKTREVKTVTIWTAERLNAAGRPARDPGSVTYSAAIESAAVGRCHPAGAPSAFDQRVRREADRRGYPAADRRIVIGDGARWIWRVAREQCPGAIEIVDLFHAKERLWDVAKALHAGDKARTEAWAEARCDELAHGSFHALLRSLDAVSGHCEEAQKGLGYFRRNRQRMRYPEFRAAGLCVGSGVVEAGCKHVVGTRLKRPGMHWSVAGANAILALRCCVLSQRFDDFWETRRTIAVPRQTA